MGGCCRGRKKKGWGASSVGSCHFLRAFASFILGSKRSVSVRACLCARLCLSGCVCFCWGMGLISEPSGDKAAEIFLISSYSPNLQHPQGGEGRRVKKKKNPGAFRECRGDKQLRDLTVSRRLQGTLMGCVGDTKVSEGVEGGLLFVCECMFAYASVCVWESGCLTLLFRSLLVLLN